MGYPIKMSAKKHVKTWELLFRMETGKTMANRALPSRKKLVNRAIASEIRLTGFANKRFEFKPQNVELRDLWTFFGHGMMTKGNKKWPEANALRRVCRWPPKKSNHYPTW